MLVDDHTLFLEGFSGILIQMLPPGTTVDIFSTIDTAKAAFKKASYGILITDLNMPGQNVMNFIAFCRRNYKDLIIMIVSSSTDTNAIRNCLAAGANAYLSKSVNSAEIKQALAYTMSGKKFVSADLSGKLADHIFSGQNKGLTNKEQEVLILIGTGKRTKEIADMLFISPVTVMTHKRSIMQKLDLHSTVELVRYVINNNLI